MKKILSILMILVLVGGVAFAQVEPTFTGEATLSWGIDLGKGTDKDGSAKLSHGFLNEASASVSLPFVKSGASKGEGDVYAFINLSGVSLGLAADMKGAKATGKVGDVEAKVVFYGGYVTFYNAPSMATTYAAEAMSLHIGDIWGNFESGFEGYGTKIGYAKKDMMDLDVALKLVSNGSWKDRDGSFGAEFVEMVEIKANRDNGTGVYYLEEGYELRAADGTVTNGPDDYVRLPSGMYAKYRSAYTRKDKNGQYGFGLDFHMEPVEKYLTVDANFNMTLSKGKKYQKVKSNWMDSNAMNFGVKLSSSPVEGLNLALGFDGGSAFEYTKTDGKKDGMFAWALGFGADYTNKMVGTVDFGMYVASKATPYGKGTVVDAEKGEKNGMDMAMTLGYSGLPIVEGLDIHARFNVFRLLSKISKAEKENKQTIPFGVNFGAAYTRQITDSVSIKPYADMWVESNSSSYYDGTDPANQKAYIGLAYKLGVSIMPLERLTIDLNWSQGKPFAPSALLGSGLTLGIGQKWRSEPIQHKGDNGRFVVSAKITY